MQVIKDPNAKLDYKISWAQWLPQGDAIAASTWVNVTAGITTSAAAFTDTATSIWIEDGTVDTIYSLTNRVTTDAGRIDDRTFTVLIQEK